MAELSQKIPKMFPESSGTSEKIPETATAFSLLRGDHPNLSVSRWAVAHILRVFSLVWNPAELGSVGEFTEVEAQKRSSAWC